MTAPHPLLRRYADKPFERAAASLSEIDKTEDYIATHKYDGWRTLVVIDEQVQFYSRELNKLPVGKEIQEAVKALDLPRATVLDTEWMARRPGHQGKELLYLITVPWWENQWQGNNVERERWALTQRVNFRATALGVDRSTFPIRLPLYASHGYSDFFVSSKNDPSTEGIVLKRWDSKLIGDMRDSKQNPGWIKVKWRKGNDGKFIVA